MSELKGTISKLGKYKYPLIILIIGLFLLLLPSRSSTGGESAATDDELRFKAVLENTVGVGDASVLISESGVVIVCDGAGNSGVKLSIIKAAEVFTGFSSDKIEILKSAD